MVHYLINKARSMIYTTALPPNVIRNVYFNWKRAISEPWRRKDCQDKSTWFREKLRYHGFNIGASESQIIPLLVGSNETAVQFSQALQEKDILAVAIRPPTVPQGTARIRFTVMALHDWEDLHRAMDEIVAIGRRLGVIVS